MRKTVKRLAVSFLVVCLASLLNQILAQGRQITGKVTASENREPLVRDRHSRNLFHPKVTVNSLRSLEESTIRMTIAICSLSLSVPMDQQNSHLPSEDMVVRSCTVYHAHGGFVIGSEMSGGAKNLYVSDCSFIGTDIGLRFKTTRGRGGLVEKIYVNNITMKDIVGEAILFDMYYAAQDPVPVSGERREPPKVELKKVDETTPQFRNFHISNIVCNGAEKAIFIRGLPEMHVKDITLENLTMTAKKGIDMQEASAVSLRNVRLICSDTNPVVDILNSDNILFDRLNYKDGSQLLFRIGGDRTKGINIQNTDATGAKQKIQYEFGATEKAVTVKQVP
jgi:hypothetical protein